MVWLMVVSMCMVVGVWLMVRKHGRVRFRTVVHERLRRLHWSRRQPGLVRLRARQIVLRTLRMRWPDARGPVVGRNLGEEL